MRDDDNDNVDNENDDIDNDDADDDDYDDIYDSDYNDDDDDDDEVDNTLYPAAIWTYGGTAKGAECMLPFTYEGATHSECIEVYDGEMPWCMTNNGKWGYCAPDGEFHMCQLMDTTLRAEFLIEATCV